MNTESSGLSDPHGKIDIVAELDNQRRWLRTVIAARSGEPQAVDEIMQEVSLAAVKQAAPLRDPSKVAPWLYQIAVRQSLMYRRKHGRRRKHERHFAEQLETRPVPQEPNPLDWLIAEERRQLIREGMERLSPKDRELLMLKYTENWSYQEIAEHLNTTASAIESRLHRARAKFRQIMASLEPAKTSEG